jgi:hypothetical protein
MGHGRITETASANGKTKKAAPRTFAFMRSGRMTEFWIKFFGIVAPLALILWLVETYK